MLGSTIIQMGMNHFHLGPGPETTYGCWRFDIGPRTYMSRSCGTNDSHINAIDSIVAKASLSACRSDACYDGTATEQILRVDHDGTGGEPLDSDIDGHGFQPLTSLMNHLLAGTGCPFFGNHRTNDPPVRLTVAAEIGLCSLHCEDDLFKKLFIAGPGAPSGRPVR